MLDSRRDPLTDPQVDDEFEIRTPAGPGHIRVVACDVHSLTIADVADSAKQRSIPRTAWIARMAPIARWLSPASSKNLNALGPYMAELHAVNFRFKQMTHEEFKAAELAQLRELWNRRPDVPGLPQLIERIEREPPSVAFRDRAFETMKGMVICFFSMHAPTDDLCQALDGYLSARPILTEVLLDFVPSGWH